MKEGEGGMELSDKLKKQMHGVSKDYWLQHQGETNWMKRPSEFPDQNPLKAGKTQGAISGNISELVHSGRKRQQGLFERVLRV